MKGYLLLVFAMLLSAGVALGQDVLEPLYLEWGIGDSDETFYREFLYPEVQYDRNPSVLVGLENIFLRPSLLVSTEERFGEDRLTQTRTETEDSVGDAGAEEVIRWRPLRVDIGARAFVPLDNSLVIGADLGFDRRSLEGIEEQDQGWNNITDSELTETQQSNWEIRGTGYGALALNGIDLGIKAGARLFRQAGDAQREESSTGGELTAVTSLDDDLRELELDTAAGSRFSLGESLLGVGLAFNYQLAETVPWEQSVDDPTAIVPITDNDAVDEYLDQATTTDLALNASFETPLSERLRFIASGNLGLVGATVTEEYSRDEGSKELDRETVQGLFPSFSLGGGVSWTPSSAVDLRSGVMYTTMGEETFYEFYDVDGTLTNPLNEPNAPAVALGTGEVEDYQIIDNGEVRAWRLHALIFDSSITFSPAGPLTVFAGGLVFLGSETDTHMVFNTDTDEVLEADDRFGVQAMVFSPTFGGAIELSNGMLLSMNNTWVTDAVVAFRGGDDPESNTPREGERSDGYLRTDLQVIFRF